MTHSKTVKYLLNRIRKFFSACLEYIFKLHPSKCIILAQSIQFYGRRISREGVKFDPRIIDVIQDIQLPVTAAHLQQFLCAMQWIKSGLPEFKNTVAPLSDLLEQVHTNAGKRTSCSVPGVDMSQSGWSTSVEESFHRCKEALENQVTLAHRYICLRLCVYADASDLFWSGIVTQLPPEDLPKPNVYQRHLPLAFLSEKFSGS